MKVSIEDGPWLLSVLRRLAVHPAAYLGSEEVFAVELFFMAYVHARTDLGLPEHGPEEDDILPGFVRFLERRTKQTDTRGWWGLIERIDGSDSNVRTFFRLFDEYARSELGITDGILPGPPKASGTSRKRAAATRTRRFP